MSWWDDLWLNEGFARWMQTFVADDLHPEWDTGLQASSIFELGKQADAVRPFLAAAASIRQNALDVTKVLPELDAWIRTH